MQPTRSNGALVLISCFAIAGAAGQIAIADEAAPEPVFRLEKAVENEVLYFCVWLEQPDGADRSAFEQRGMFGQSRFQSTWSEAELYGRPAWRCPCYVESFSADQFTGSKLQFFGKCSVEDVVHLTLRFPHKSGVWRETPVKLDFANARTAELETLRRGWAVAQARHFETLQYCVGGVGGYFTFAAGQTRRQHDIPADQNNVRLIRTEPSRELYDLTTGALAIQKSLQLDRMTDPNRDRSERLVNFEDILPVTVRSHTFDEMRKGKTPVHSALAELVPEDQYYLRFNSMDKLRELLDFANQWGPSLLRLAEPVGADYGIAERVRQQLCLPDTLISRMLGPTVVRELAVTGSDPYLREGSDITILFDVRTRTVFQHAVDRHFESAADAFEGAKRNRDSYHDIAIESLVSPFRRVSCFRCWLGDVCVYSNSATAIRRIIDTHAKERPCLAAAADFRYMRAVVYPMDHEKEDGFLYLSDSFIRNLVGPETRIKEVRRLQAMTSMRMLTNATLFHGHQHGPGVPTIDELTRTASLTASDVYDPEGGMIYANADGVGYSTAYGSQAFLTPLLEIEAGKATSRERDDYAVFRVQYSNYWRQFFDPIGVRISVRDTIRLETCILPLIDLSAYNEFKDLAGGKPLSVDLDQFGDKTLFRFVMQFNDGPRKKDILSFASMATGTNVTTDWVGDWLTFWIEDSDALMEVMKESAERYVDATVDFFDATFVAGIHVKNKISLAAFLVAAQAAIHRMAPNTVVFKDLDPYLGVTIVRIAPDPSSGLSEFLNPDSPPETEPDGPAVYYATIGDGFYISTQQSALRNLIDRAADPVKPAPDAHEPVSANVLLFADPAAASSIRPTVAYMLEQQIFGVSQRNLVQVQILGRCGVLANRTIEEAAQKYLGYRIECPDGGTYRYEATSDKAVCSVHGSIYEPIRLNEPPADSPLNDLLNSLKTVTASMRFTPEGLESAVEISRRPSPP